jgi:AcrR family transcriptional regulator
MGVRSATVAARPPSSVEALGVPDEHELPPGSAEPSTRGRILAAGLGYFAELGYHGASIRDIASASGVQPAALYRHFPGKEDVLATLIYTGYDSLHRALRGALLSAPPDPAAQLRTFVRVMVLAHTRHWRLALVVQREMYALSDDRAAPSLAIDRLIRDLIDDVVQRGTAQGVLSPSDSDAAVTALLDMLVRVATWYRPDHRDSPEAIADRYEALALRLFAVT